MGRFGRSRIFHTSTIDFFRTLFSIFFTAIYLSLYIFEITRKFHIEMPQEEMLEKLPSI